MFNDVLSVNGLSNEPCYYIPHELFNENKYKDFPVETKVLFGILLTRAEKTTSIMRLPELIELIGENKIKKMMKEIRNINQKGGTENV